MSSNWKLSHIGVIVRDLDKVVEYYQSLGIAELTPEFALDNSSFAELILNASLETNRTEV